MNIGLRDKYDQGSGLRSSDPKIREYHTEEHTVFIDTRDCIGSQSFVDAVTYANATGTRGPASGHISHITNTGYPTVITSSNASELGAGDIVIIEKIHGSGIINGTSQTVLSATSTTFTIDASCYDLYKGGGIWSRLPDAAFPKKTNKDSMIINNEIQAKLTKDIKYIRSISLYHIVIPRDIVPLTTYLGDFISVSTSSLGYSGDSLTFTPNYTNYIQQESKYLDSRLLGFYSSDLELFRTYIGGTFSLPDQVTPIPLTLWNTDAVGQPGPYPYQTVPTYKSSNFSISGYQSTFYVMLSGYGVYDLADWTDPGSREKTEFMRTLLLLIIAPKQSYRDVDYIDLILNSSKTSSADVGTDAFGFGDYQRFVPGPGLGQNYQPNTINNGIRIKPSWTDSLINNPTETSVYHPVAFPNFVGNVWGPYNRPGDRFQRVGLRSLVQDLFLNGDLQNIAGSPIIYPDVLPEDIPKHPSFGLNFAAIRPVNLGNISNSSNLNILNAQRIIPNGFGAKSNYVSTTVKSTGFADAGGIGPSLVPESSWSGTGVYGDLTGTIISPIAQGPSAGTSEVSSSTAPTNNMTNNTSYYDFGPNGGQFITNVLRYINFVVNEIPDTDLIIRINEAKRNERAQSTNTFNSDALLDCPIRLSIGSTSGTIQYIESLQSLVGNASAYWEDRLMTPKTELSKLTIRLYTYDNKEIPIEKMLQFRQASGFLQLLVKTQAKFSEVSDSFNSNVFLNFLFDPLNPKLLGRVKRYIQIIFKVGTYAASSPGQEPTSGYKDGDFI